MLQQRDEEWREELSNRDKALRVELKERKRKDLHAESAKEGSRANQADGGKGEGNGAELVLEV